MTYRVVQVQSFWDDLDAHLAYLKAEGVSIDRIEERLAEIVQATLALATWPYRHAREDVLALQSEYRKMIFGQYLALYRVDESNHVVYVTRFIHGARRHRLID